MSILDQAARKGKIAALAFLLFIVAAVLMTQLAKRPVELPPEHHDALYASAPQEHWQGATVETRRLGTTYHVDFTQELSDGRLRIYQYSVDSGLNVEYLGLRAGRTTDNRLGGILVGLLIASAILAGGVFIFMRRVFTAKCARCGSLLLKEDKTLFRGSISKSGETLAPIVLTTWTCPDCDDHTVRKVAVAGEHRAGSIKTPAVVRLQQEDKMQEITESFLESRTMTYEDWEQLLKELKDQYEGEG